MACSKSKPIFETLTPADPVTAPVVNVIEATPQTTLEHYPQIDRKRAMILQTLARTGTPIFLCERDNLIDRYRALYHCLSQTWRRHLISYSFKTNYLVAKSGLFRELGGWAEVVSGREYRLARQLGYPGQSIIFNGPYKTELDLRSAIEDGALLNVNDHDELDRIVELSACSRLPIGIGLRLSSSLPRLGHSRFGFSIENGEATGAVEKIRQASRLDIAALHMHLYGDTDEAAIYSHAANRLGQFAKQHLAGHHEALRFIDLGGGFPAHGPKPKSRETWKPQPIDVYIRAIADSLKPFFPDNGAQPTLVVEPGRYLTSDGIILVTRVHHVKERDRRQAVSCNGSISMVPLTHYCPQIIRVYTSELEQRTGAEVPTIIYGSTCRENDILYEGPFPKTEPGDYLVHYAAGAYNSSLSPDFVFESPGMEMI